jgi:2-polyprenyl-3-methyl-5-hydroxy-6-metoxy-1,4-benzoquinol methylase
MGENLLQYKAPIMCQSDLYAGYEAWKGWSEPFIVSADEASYFAGETRGLKIENAVVLEIGFGSGSFLAWARQHGASVAGTEINEILLSAAREFGVELLPADFERVSQEHASRFDTIVAFDVFEHFSLTEIVTRLRAAEVMLKASGNLIMRFPNAQSPFGLAPQNGDPTHKSALSRSVFEQLIQGTTFKVVRYAPSFHVARGSIPERIARRLRLAARGLISRFLNAIYAQDIPWDPVVVLVLRRAESRSDLH